jgi:gentisate 1,2-dioxygenase
MMDTSFAEHYPGGTMAVTREESACAHSFPYSRSRAMLQEGTPDPWHGVRMHYGEGEFTTPTIDAWLRLLPAGFRTRPYRSTDATVFCAVEGYGRSVIGDTALNWGPHDIFMVPSWLPVTHEAAEESVLFSFSDLPLQKALGLWREEKIG